MDADEGVAVAAFVEYGEFELERDATVALGDHRRSGRENGRQRGRQLTPEALRQPVRRVEEDEIVLTSLPRCAAEEPPGLGAAHVGLRSQRLQIGPDGADRGR